MSPDLFSLKSYCYELPADLIARHPCEPRDHSRLMIVYRQTGEIREIPFYALTEELSAGDTLVFNDAKVIPARLLGRRSTGGKAEILLVRRCGETLWEAIGRPGRQLRPGTRVTISPHLTCEILEELGQERKLVQLHCVGEIDQQLECDGQLPIPSYLKRDYDPLRDSLNYQTVLARNAGAVAAPTAALHFSEEMLNRLRLKGVEWTTVTLDVSLATTQPVRTEEIREHPMHKERFYISEETSSKLRSRVQGKRQVCVGTTTCRVLESAVHDQFASGARETEIFIYPGYSFQYVEALMTNFHTPGSTLLMLVSAFAGYELIREAYAKAIERRFRFFSYGDSMLIL